LILVSANVLVGHMYNRFYLGKTDDRVED
jgi:hypothetical protein